MKTLLFALAAVAAAVSVRADEAPAAEAPAVAEEQQPEVMKKKAPRKEAEYRDWNKVSAAAEAWEQPIIAFIEVSGDKKNAPLRMKTVGVKEFVKEFVPKNALYFHATVPSVKQKQAPNPQGGKREKPPARPDWEAMNKNLRGPVQRLASGRGASLPAIVLTDSTGRVIDGTLGACPPETFAGWIASLKSAMEAANFKVEITGKLQSAMDKELKQTEKAKARKK